MIAPPPGPRPGARLRIRLRGTRLPGSAARGAAATGGKPSGSRLLHSIDRLSSRPLVAWTLLTADALWVVFSVVLGFPSRLETVFQTLVSAMTLALVFVIQHTQSREQLVTQRKLDEILRALPRADNTVIGLEEASDTELAAVHADHRELREQATGLIR